MAPFDSNPYDFEPYRAATGLVGRHLDAVSGQWLAAGECNRISIAGCYDAVVVPGPNDAIGVYIHAGDQETDISFKASPGGRILHVGPETWPSPGPRVLRRLAIIAPAGLDLAAEIANGAFQSPLLFRSAAVRATGGTNLTVMAKSLHATADGTSASGIPSTVNAVVKGGALQVSALNHGDLSVAGETRMVMAQCRKGGMIDLDVRHSGNGWSILCDGFQSIESERLNVVDERLVALLGNRYRNHKPNRCL